MTNTKKVTRRVKNVFTGFGDMRAEIQILIQPSFERDFSVMCCGKNDGYGTAQRATDTHHVKITVETWEIKGGKKK